MTYMTFAQRDTDIQKKKYLITTYVRKKALNACNIAYKRINKNVNIKWTKEAYRSRKYQPYTKLAIFNFVIHNSALLYSVGFRPWYLSIYSTLDVKQELPLANISDYKKHYYDYSLLRLKHFPEDYGATLDSDAFNKLVKTFNKSCKRTPFVVVSMSKLRSVVDDLVGDCKYP